MTSPARGRRQTVLGDSGVIVVTAGRGQSTWRSERAFGETEERPEVLCRREPRDVRAVQAGLEASSSTGKPLDTLTCWSTPAR